MACYPDRILYACVIVVVLAVVIGFNIDTTIPVIKEGPADSYFGFSVAQHQQLEATTVTGNFFIIGAPKLDVQTFNENFTGGVYKCNASSPRRTDCELLLQNEFREGASLDIGRNHQWLGVSVRSGGAGKGVVACAHRYKDIKQSLGKPNIIYGLGICYQFTQALQYDINHGLGNQYNPCKGLSMVQEHEEYAFCQAGISSFISKDERLVMGAPGPMSWTGMLAEVDVSPAFGSKRLFRSTTSKKDVPTPPVLFNSYLGYSVVAGKFGNTNLTYYVAGAPHSLENGQVIFFTEMPSGNTLNYDATQALTGDLPFSGFGMDLIAVDINNDGYEELLVSCPYYYVKEKDSIRLGGAVYIYSGQGQMINNNTKPQIIKGRSLSQEDCDKLQCLHARFGFSLAQAGDLNNDGYQDIAVGAPYEGRGAVYIYHGSKDGIKEPFSQRIYAEDILTARGWNTFGYSLSGGMDLDQNSYPDILVGSYIDNMVALLRTRPIISLHANVTVSPNKLNMSSDEQKQCQFEGRKMYCLMLKLCLRYTAQPVERFASPINIIYTIIAEPTRKQPRVEFLKNNTFVQTVDDTLKLLSQRVSGLSASAMDAQFSCITEIAYLKDQITDVVTAIEFGISYRLPKKPIPTPSPTMSTLPDINEYPVLDDGLSQTETMALITVDFVKKCGEDQICTSNLQMKVDLLGLNINDMGQAVLEIGSSDTLIVKVDLQNKGEIAYQTTFYIVKPRAFTWQQSDPKDIGCSPVNETMVECKDIGSKELGKPLKENDIKEFILYFQIDNTYVATVRAIELEVWVNTTSEELTPLEDHKTIPIVVYVAADVQVTGRSEPDSAILYSGSVRGESGITNEHMIGRSVNHTFTVYNNGPGVVESSEITIYWPYELASKYSHGKYLLYLMQPPQVLGGGDATCIDQPEIVNVAGIQEDYALNIQPRPYRAEIGSGPEYNVEGGERQRRNVKADNSTQVQMKNEEPVTGTARENKHVVLLDYRTVDEVQIRSTGKLHIRPELNVVQSNTENDIGYATTIAIPSIQLVEEKPIAWWIYALAVLGGILLLIVLALCLWKLGFFKRKRYDEVSTYNVKVEKKKNIDNPTYSTKVEIKKDYRDDNELEHFLTR